MLAALIALASGCDSAPSKYRDGDELLGGQVSVRDTTPNAFGQPAPGLQRQQQLEFAVGNSFFKRNWVSAPASTTARDGLGPLFNARSCAACHLKDGRGRPPGPGEVGTGLLVRLSMAGQSQDGSPLPVPGFGRQLQDQAIDGFQSEGRLQLEYSEREGVFGDGTRFSLREPSIRIDTHNGDLPPGLLTSARVGSQLVGVGLLEAVPEEQLLERADPNDEDQDGISGRPNRVWASNMQQVVLGRFGWKANQPTLEQQVASAFLGDMGISSPLLREPCSGAQCEGEFAEPDIDAEGLRKVVLYTATLAVPAQRDAQTKEVQRGRRLFFEIGCEACHREQLATGTHAIEALRNQSIRPYTDLLLHDMGTELADGRPEFAASGTEWRTPPLWGIGLIETVNGHRFLLHDGRARGVVEAILWHGGEGEVSREAFRLMNASDRDALVRFVKSL